MNTTQSPTELPSSAIVRRLVRAAKRCAKLAADFSDADAELKRLMTARYGPHDEMPDPIVEITQYGATGETITIQWLDREMTAAGCPPNT